MIRYLPIIFLSLFCLSAFGAESDAEYFDPESQYEDESIYDFSEREPFFIEPEEAGEVPLRPGEKRYKNWVDGLFHGYFNLNDSTIHYPRFVHFCMNVYDWADKTFNSYDPAYVEGTGKRWKVRVLSDNWLDSYYLNPGKRMPIRMMSDPYYNIGAYIQYMAVSVGYSFDINNMLGLGGPNHKKFEYSFNCARFNIEGHYWENSGGTYIRTFSGFNDGKLIKKRFNGVSLHDFEIYGYYFFNNKKFSMGAAYNFSKFQRKSAGSAVIGFGYNDLDITIDLNQLPEDLKPYLQIPEAWYKFHYRSYSLISGYSYNWVIHRNLLFNASLFPGMGLTVTYADNSEGNAKLLAMNIKARSSLTYNLNNFFICAVAKMDGNWYLSGHNNFFSSVENVQLSVGYRF